MANIPQEVVASTAPKELSVAQQQEAIKEEILRFTKLAREKGFLTIEEINDLLPAEIIEPAVLDSFMQALEVGGVIITELSEKKEEEGEAGAFLADPNKEEDEDDDDDDKKSSEEDAKGNDPVRLYLRKMGSVSLLTREGEVEIARRIEKGEREIVKAILLSPIGTDEIIQLGTRLDQGRIKVKAIFRGLEDEETQYNEQEYIDKVHELIGHVKIYKEKTRAAFAALRVEGQPFKTKQETEKALMDLNNEVMAHFESINFNRKTINRIVIKFKNLV
ncbi:MAG: RNA polymerase sigma factor RpoD, partial [Proteobacteria bacterium]